MRFTIFTLYILLFSLWLGGCKNSDSPDPNLPPLPYTVTATLSSSGIDIVLNWTKAKDPNGDPITYSIAYKDTLVKNLSDTTFTISNIGYNVAVIGTVIAFDSHKASTSSAFTITTGKDVIIPDNNFEQYLIYNGVDDVIDGHVRLENVLKTTVLNLTGSYGRKDKIDDLTGIQAFVNLKELDCYDNNLTALDVSKNRALARLYCSSNKLTTLDLSHNPVLIGLDCSYNPLNNLDLSKNDSLYSLACNNTPLTNLDVSNNPLLISIGCSFNKLSSLDVSKCSNLVYLYCYSNSLTSLISNNPSLKVLECQSNNLTELDLSKNKSLYYLRCGANKIKTICVPNLTQITNFVKDGSATFQVCK